MIDIMEVYDSMQRTKRILSRIGYQGKRVFSDKDMADIVDTASFDALEDLAQGVRAFNNQDLGYVARNYGAGSEIIRRIFKDYKTKDSEKSIFTLKHLAQCAIDGEKYPFVINDAPMEVAA